MEIKLHVEKNRAILEGDGDSILEKIVAGVKGKIKIKTPLGDRDVKIKEAKTKK